MTYETDENKLASLRQQAEASIKQGQSPNLADLSPEDIQGLIHELQVHQIELQLQNEELQRAQLDLWEARNRYADLYNFAPVGYFTLDAQGAIVEANLTGALLLNVDRSSLIGAPLSRFVAPEDRDKYAVYRVRLWQSEEPQAAAIRLVKKDSASFPAWLEGVAAYDREGRFVQARLAASDMTERVRAEEALEESQRRLQALFNNTLDAILLADDEAHFVDANPTACALLGYNREELLKLSVWEITPGGYRELGQELWQAFIRSGQQGGEYTVLRKDGITVEADYRAVANIVPGLHLSVLRDITGRKQEELAQRLLAEAGEVLASSLDYQTILQRLAYIPIPHFADWFMIHMVEEDGTIQRVAMAHADPAKLELMQELRRCYPTDPNVAHGYPQVIRTGQAELLPEIPSSVLPSVAKDAEHLGMLQALNLTSNLCVPLIARGQTLGTLTFAWAESGRHYGPEDLALAEELAQRTALAIDNARLYQEAQQLNAELEHRVLQRTTELETANRILKNEIAERQRSQARFVTIFHTSPIPISVTTWAEGRFLDVNDSFLEWLGYRLEEVIGRTSRELGFQTDAELRPKILDMLQGQVALRNLEKSYYTKLRQLRQAIVSVEKIELEGEACLLTVFYDVTEREQMAAELAEIQHWLVESLERERIHLAQELHDGPVQELYGVSFGLSGLKEALSSEADLAQLTAAQTGIQQVVQMLRTTFSDLRPPALAPFGLEKAILSHVEQFQQQHPELKMSLKLMPDGQDLPERIRLALFRIYREALNNIVRHAQAQQVWIAFTLDAAQAVLEVKDDGRGFEAPQRWVELARQGHLGLVGISERVEAMGGQLQIISTPEAGALIRVTVPRADDENR